MKLVFVDQLRLYRTPDGRVWGLGGAKYSYYARFLETFDTVRVVSRVEPIPRLTSDLERCDGPGVAFLSPPLYVGPWEYLRSRRRLAAFLSSVYATDVAYLLRVPSQLSFDMARVLRRAGHPFGLFVVADPYGDFSPGATRSILRPYLRRRFCSSLRTLCREAGVCAYVTRRALQDAYPCREGAGVDGVSDVEMPIEWLCEDARKGDVQRATVLGVCVGSLANMSKGADTLIEALAILAGWNCPLKVVFAGSGKHLPEVVRLARSRGVSKRIHFVGAANRARLRELFDSSDVYLMASRTEGMPRALLEAMGRALPCIATNVGGIPEVLAPEDMAPPNDAAAFARKVAEVLATSGRLSSMSRRNLCTARDFRVETLRTRHLEMQARLCRCTAEWLRCGSGCRQPGIGNSSQPEAARSVTP
jgi:glycosyltransferase involved in cell wall biosynthesis